MELNLIKSIGMLKHNVSTEEVAQILSFLIENDSFLLFSFYERNLLLFELEIQEFINERRLFTNSEWVLPWEETIPHWDQPNNTPPKIIWFSVKTKDEIIKAIDIDSLFRCVVVKEGDDFYKYSNVIFQQEYYATFDEENFEHYIGFTNKVEFRDATWSELKNRFHVNVVE
ncbi:hypothetical protein [Brevibacillus porteri]|uniref:Uncharacterized protein n=1 Tax=Brevibacillus porteri TaxID=2126350 RepID=A0ABX5FRY2_9BACL|nr:hypothetical protein [Brevibacillus porteri]MED1798010.1 hypothetical protein [Brevibacillus porteri]MED2132155.1 hypothetical protein [Brevibacillus porteri]MED2742718.1 hypothetical protein [Brevibacillus porteri]MED2814194.1 hypothetical protein [Brevibacillus porteri]MED2893755.1 hypothetical protein [Brevibacillus porteri]